MNNTTYGGASRAILRANQRTYPRSSTVVHSLGFALIYPQPCSTIHPPVANKPFYFSGSINIFCGKFSHTHFTKFRALLKI